MIRKMSMLRSLFSFTAVLFLSFSVLADTIRLKDGSLIKGTIIGFSDGRFVVAVGEGARRRELTLSADEIASIEFDPRADATSTRSSLPQKDSSIVSVSTKPAAKTPVKQTEEPVEDETEPVDNVPPRNTDSKPVTQNTPRSTPRSTSTATPISLNVKVLADNTANGWTNSGWVVKKGQRIRITGSGTVSLGRGKTSTPSGLPELDDEQKLLKAVPTGALLAVIGDDNNDFIYIGTSREFTAARDGALYLGINEGNLNDNSGSFEVKVEIIPES